MPDEVPDTPADAASTPDNAGHDLRQRVAVLEVQLEATRRPAGHDDDNAGNRAAALRRSARDIRDDAAAVTGAGGRSAPATWLALAVAEGVTMTAVGTPVWRRAKGAEGAGVGHPCT